MTKKAKSSKKKFANFFQIAIFKKFAPEIKSRLKKIEEKKYEELGALGHI